MNDGASFRKLVAITALVAGVLILASTVILSMAVDFNFELLEAPEDMLTAGLEPASVDLFRWGEILGVFGYFLLLIPVMLYFWYWLAPHNPRLVTLYTILGLISIVLGIIEAAIRVSIWAPMMVAYPQAAEAQRVVLEIVFRAVTDFAFEGLYGIGSILGGLWWLGIGLALRAERRLLGMATAVMGVAILGAGIGWLGRVDPLSRLELMYFFEPFWLIWLAVVIGRDTEKSRQTVDVVPAV